MAHRVLLIQKDQGDRAAVLDALSPYWGFEVRVARSGREGFRSLAEKVPDLVVLCPDLPDIDAEELCQRLRSRSRTAHLGILVVSFQSSEPERVRCLRFGADDFLSMPLGEIELRERLRAVLRRVPLAPPSVPPFRGRHLVAKFDEVDIAVDGVPVSLTRREMDLLRCLVQQPNRVLSRDALLRLAWGAVVVRDQRTVDGTVRRLRSKLGHAGAQIQTVPGLGYRFREPK
jgi:DNA-binding response OmpR family regulator